MSFPYECLCLDIETANGDPTDAERWARTYWSPNKSWKPTTIGERYLEALQKKQERLALLDTSPILSIAIKTGGELRCLHAMNEQREVLDGALVEGFGGEMEMLAAFRNLLDAGCDDATLFVGHNIRHFDLPKLRHAFLRHGLRLPFALVNRDQPVFDIMREYGHQFSLENDCFISAKDVAEQLGLGGHKSVASGADVPALYAVGNHGAIVAYALLDVLLEWDLFLRMTGQNADGLTASLWTTPSPAAEKAPDAMATTNSLHVLGAQPADKSLDF